MIYASEFSEILPVLTNNLELRARVLLMIKTKPLHYLAIEEDERAKEFRNILIDLVNGDIPNLEGSYERVHERLPKEYSKYKNNKEVFHEKWNEYLVRIQLSRFYSHAVLNELKENKKEECIIPEARTESNCVLQQNRIYKVTELIDSMMSYYDFGRKDTVIKIPEHQNCPHVVKPLL